MDSNINCDICVKENAAKWSQGTTQAASMIMKQLLHVICVRRKHTTKNLLRTQKGSIECELCEKEKHTENCFKDHIDWEHQNQKTCECDLCQIELREKNMVEEHHAPKTRLDQIMRKKIKKMKMNCSLTCGTYFWQR